jgi:hypothetical protein
MLSPGDWIWVGLYHRQTVAAHFRTAGVDGRYGDSEAAQERPMVAVVVVDEVHADRDCIRPGYSYHSGLKTVEGG